MHHFIDQRGPDECWPWTGYRNPKGYGRVVIQQRWFVAHRHAYEQQYGPISPGLVIDHLCRNRACCNPSHLEAVTPGENWRRGERVGVDRCKHGHLYTPENTVFTATGRNCRECKRAAWRAWQARKRDRVAS